MTCDVSHVTSFSSYRYPPDADIRLRNRSSETADKIAIRLEKAQHELTYEPRFDAVVVNDVLEDAFIQAEILVREFLQK